MTECRALFHALITVTPDLADVVARVNNLLGRPAGWQVCDGILRSAFARRPTLSWSAPGRHRCSSTTPAAASCWSCRRAAFRRASWPIPLRRAHPLDDGARRLMLLVTDGFLECTDAAGGLFGSERLKAVIRAHSACSSADIIRGMTQAIEAFAGGLPLPTT